MSPQGGKAKCCCPNALQTLRVLCKSMVFCAAWLYPQSDLRHRAAIQMKGKGPVLSGIAAHFRFDGGPANIRTIRAMTDAMAYRGPDGIAHYCEGQAALGYLAMHASAQAHEAPQPLANEDGSIVLVMDGYVANHAALKADLLARGARLRSAADGELVLRAYEQWGADCPRHIDGEFAFVIWDKIRREAFCARDHHGLRPLFWHWHGETLTIASDIVGVLAALPDKPACNLGYLAEIAVDETFSPDETVWSKIYRLNHAHSLQVSRDGRRLHEYWTLPETVSIRYKSDGEYFEHYRSVLEKCVQQASRTHLPLAFEVSGGLDSSSLFCVADALEKEGRLPAPCIAGYTLAGPEGSAAYELEYARAIGNHLGRSLTEVPLFQPGLDWFARRASEDCDMPPFPNAAMSIGMDRAIRADGSRVAINGVGGDQWLDGTHFYYRELMEAGDWRSLLASYREDRALMGTLEASKLFARLGPGSYLPRRLRRLRRRFTGDDERAWRGPDSWLLGEVQGQVSARMARYEAGFPPEYRDGYKLRKLKLPRWTQILDLISRQRAREGLENRSPMMSRAFIEFSAQTPERMRLRGGVTKYLHRKALSDIMPDQVTWRFTKAEFSAVYDSMAKQLHDECLTKSPQVLAKIANFDGLALLFAKYRDAAIDERGVGEIWGIYVCAQVLKLRDGVSPK